MTHHKVALRYGFKLWLAASLVSVPLGCEFHPLYIRQNQWILAQIHINPIGDRIGQILRYALIDRMTPHGIPERPHYALSVKLDLSTQPFQTTAGANVVLSATYSLEDLQQSKHPVVLTSTVRAVTSYHSHDTPYAIVVAERAALRQAVYQLAEEIVERTALYFYSERAESLCAQE